MLKLFNFNHIWDNQSALNVNTFTYNFKKKILTKFELYWLHAINHNGVPGGKLSTYSTFKSIFKREDYLSFFAKFSDRRIIARFRMGSHKLEIESGRYHRPPIPRDDRICRKCNLGVTESEMHAILECPAHTIHRQTLLTLMKHTGTPILNNKDLLRRIVSFDEQPYMKACLVFLRVIQNII